MKEESENWIALQHQASEFNRVPERVSEFEWVRANGRASDCKRVLASASECERVWAGSSEFEPTCGQARTSKCKEVLVSANKCQRAWASSIECKTVRANRRAASASEFEWVQVQRDTEPGNTTVTASFSSSLLTDDCCHQWQNSTTSFILQSTIDSWQTA